MRAWSLLLVLVLSGFAFAAPSDYFVIRVVDESTGRGVPLVELKTTANVLYYTDNAGIVAFNEPGLMNRRVWFWVQSHGYEHAADGFGYRGEALQTIPGTTATVKIKRINIAERLYRTTGAGLYRDSLLAGLPTPIQHPDIQANIIGMDSTQNIVWNGSVFWVWGDTGRTAYPLGNFHGTAATSELPSRGGLDPDVGVDYHFYTKGDFVKGICPLPEPGPVWLGGFMQVEDPSGKPAMVCGMSRMKDLGTRMEIGMVVWSETAEQFYRGVPFDLDRPLEANGHPMLVRSDGELWYYLCAPFPYIRVRARWDDVMNQRAYESFTMLPAGEKADGNKTKIERGDDGRARYAWKADTGLAAGLPLFGLIQAGKLSREEAWPALSDIDGGTPVLMHGGNLAWNAYRNRWSMVGVQQLGTSFLGEVWYAEADTPLGPWGYAKKIVTHDTYTFYNPKQHPYFAREDGRIVYFEGTYSFTFSGNKVATPWYDYNPVMYKLDLADARLALPVPVYRMGEDDALRLRPHDDSWTYKSYAGEPEVEVAFFALPPGRVAEAAIAVYRTPSGALDVKSPRSGASPLFYGLPAERAKDDASLVVLAATDHGWRVFEADAAPEGALCAVWRTPAGRMEFDFSVQPAETY